MTKKVKLKPRLAKIKPVELALANENYGGAKAHFHDAGYAFERGCQKLRTLLAGKHWRECAGGFADVDAFLASLQVEEFAKAMETKKQIAKLIKDLRPEISSRAIGRAVGLNESTVRRGAAEKSKKANQSNEGARRGTAPTQTSGAKAAAVVARAERVREQQRSTSDRVAKVAFDAKAIGRFSLIYGDPPWEDDFGPNRRSTENHYPTMSLDEICALPVSEIAHEQAMLFLWTTTPMLEQALAVMKAWGFEYRTHIIWVKPTIGLGKYVRQRHEPLLIGRRGEHPTPDPENLPNSVIEAPRGEHSEKPEVFLEMIEKMYPAATKIELFRRGTPRDGWSAWGAETKNVEVVSDAAE